MQEPRMEVEFNDLKVDKKLFIIYDQLSYIIREVSEIREALSQKEDA